MGKEIQQFITEDGGATGLEHHDWGSCSNLLFQSCQGGFEQMLRTIEHAEIVEWSPAADLRLRQAHLVSGCFQNLNRSDSGFRMEIVVERIWPKDHGLAFSPTGPLLRPTLEPSP